MTIERRGAEAPLLFLSVSAIADGHPFAAGRLRYPER
jgi:hypothetical protein